MWQLLIKVDPAGYLRKGLEQEPLHVVAALTRDDLANAIGNKFKAAAFMAPIASCGGCQQCSDGRRVTARPNCGCGYVILFYAERQI